MQHFDNRITKKNPQRIKSSGRTFSVYTYYVYLDIFRERPKYTNIILPIQNNFFTIDL